MGEINREKEAALSHDFLRSILTYSPETGVFRWKVKRGVNDHVGRQAGYVMRNGYRLIRINFAKYLAHRLAWFYVNGAWPTLEIDHVNGSRSDNRIDNLRPATRTLNAWNRHSLTSAASGKRNIHADGSGGYRVRIMRNGRIVFQKRAKTLSKAIAIREIAIGCLLPSSDSYLSLGG